MRFDYTTLKQDTSRLGKPALLAFIVALSALVLPVLAQGKKKSVVGEPIAITILRVAKDDAGAKPDPSGRGRLVPVGIQWKTGPWNGAQLVSLEASLSTGNTDGSTTEVKKLLAVRATSDTLAAADAARRLR